MMQGANFAEIAQVAPDARNQVVAFLDQLERQLNGRSFILGNAFSLADAAGLEQVMIRVGK